ncbi:MAG: ABC transporter substrate-binding protein, partial [Pseudomonadota bacterium]|nr:ABC transporter substrate-binding protein [Pseudomonadota bacterium]
MSCKALLALVIASASFVSSTAWAERVVSIGGTVTEIVYLLGESDQLVATDTSSVYPEAANQTPKVGYQRTLSAEGVLSVRPDMLLLTTTAGPQSVLRQLEDTGIQSKVIDTPRT